ncbi:glycosyltransferase [Chryseobacterium manosquense]|uniref:Glycosyltransferase n=1 Tax=Chryseobacterium manosquense TaxID=2754694 RepID=A0A7H1DWC8_9FLAO|nr:glycosyltransferase [Chryseobacterium manosquense]QNS41286.1 glycosyltransferase [Chryseobacterium manosquense]
MNKKKDILFVMNNLNVGGAEKALVSLLQVFDYEKYNVDLLLFKKEGLFLKQVPAQVNILPEPANYRYFDMPFVQVLKDNLWPWRWDLIYRRIQFKKMMQKAESPAEAEQLSWKPLSKTLKPLQKQYDVAIGFLEKNPNYFVVDKVKAEKKIGFIHNDYHALQMNSKIDNLYFKKLDYILTVSIECLNELKELFNHISDKFKLMRNISAVQTIRNLALVKIQEDLKKDFIISVGRLNSQKNYNLAIDAFHLLHKKGISFTWYILGEGPEEESLKKKVELLGLSEKVHFLGVKQNPYQYINRANVFLMTSHFEGDGIVVREAKILCKPIILTNFNTASSHITNNETGIIVDFDAEEIANAIEKLLKSKELRNQFEQNLANLDWSMSGETQKLYHLIEN